MPTIDSSPQVPDDVRQALDVINKRIQQLPEEDQINIRELLALMADPDETEAALKGITEILSPETTAIELVDLCDKPADALSGWIGFVSKRLREVRKKSGLTQAELEQRSGIPQSHISRLEKGEHSPTNKTLQKLSNAMGVDMSEFDPSAD